MPRSEIHGEKAMQIGDHKLGGSKHRDAPGAAPIAAIVRV
jgi:hypothetical protein